MAILVAAICFFAGMMVHPAFLVLAMLAICVDVGRRDS